MTIKIEIISVKAVTKPGSKPNTTYQVLDVAYRNQTFQNKVEGRNIMSFGATAGTFKTLSTAAGGDVFDIEIVKNEKGYNDWVSAKKSNSDGNPAQPVAGRAAVSTTNASPKSTYETPEERAKKQIYIVRQSSISNAIDLLTTGAKGPPKQEDVVELAKFFEAYVFGDAAASVEPPFDFSDLEDDVPL